MKKTIIFYSLILFSVCNVNGQIPTDSLIGFWPFKGNANDLSTNNNHGIVNGAVLTFDRFGNPNSAYTFDGIDDNIDLNTSLFSTTNPYQAYTVSSWIKSIANSGIIISQYTLIPSPASDRFLFMIRNSHLDYFKGGFSNISNTVINDGQWHHVVAIKENTGIISLYIDGILDITGNDTEDFSPTNTFIGYGLNSGEPFNGAIDDIRVYNKVLSGSEISALFNESCNSVNSTTETACDSYTAPDGQVYTSSGIKTAVIPNGAGCDSTITINLTINTVDVSVIQNGIILTAKASADFYQWLDCNNNNSIISGETSQSFSATQNGSYAVKVTQNNCSDTSVCYAVTTVGILENTLGNNITVYPNPTSGIVQIDLGETLSEFIVSLNDVNGKLISQSTYKKTKMFELNLNVQSGIYLLTINSGNNKATIRLIKN